MSENNKKLIIFDFDGVIVNTLPFCFILYKEHNPNLTLEEYQDFSKGNFLDGVKNAIDKKSHVVPDNFYEKYQEKVNNIDVIDILSKVIVFLSQNYPVSIVSSTPSKIIKNFLTKKNLEGYFSDILGSDIHSDKTIKINSLLKKYNIFPKNTVFIIDSLGDILEGNKSGVKSIGVTWGIHDKKTLEKGHPIAIIDNPRDLLETIQNVLK